MDNGLRECVLDLAAEIPAGRVSTYGRIAVEARLRCGAGTARQVGRIMATSGGEVPWWRVVTASGAPAAQVAERALALLQGEGTPLRGTRVDLHAALHTFETEVVRLGPLDDPPEEHDA
ncbi:MGMT family protein [Serinibacter salmoneus]|uniref:O(6)-alkylguanine repair protein YbaZ n=1 Tax=Serinibacter salmoneus TaxID=556530 RepID=A0A2A9CZT7_9MICO|nr:MGMT family protein [Serinibacter salmoneus]PFG19934.1 O(6)-alkylguanine repair protein YbaZ [Serinibacter salmoneus]